MKNNNYIACAIIAIVLLSSWWIASATAQNQSQEERGQEAQSRINCIVCKIVSLIILIAVPLVLLSALPVFFLGLALFLMFYDKWKKAKDDLSTRNKAKKRLTLIVAFMAVFLIVVVFSAVILFTGIIGGDCACEGITR